MNEVVAYFCNDFSKFLRGLEDVIKPSHCFYRISAKIIRKIAAYISMSWKEFVKRQVIGEPQFKVAGVTFDTAEAINGYRKFAGNLKTVDGRAAQDGMFSKSADPLLQRHEKIGSGFSELIARTTLVRPPQLLVRKNGYPNVVVVYGGAIDFDPNTMQIAMNPGHVICDESTLRLLTPKELSGVIGHELGHVELGHGTALKTSIASEFAADLRGAEISRDSRALQRALCKLEEFDHALCHASPGFVVVDGINRIVEGITHVVKGAGSGTHPLLYRRLNRLESFAERLAQEAAHGHIRIP